MATLNNLFRKLLNVNTAVFNNMRIETDQYGVTSVTVTARVKRKESHRCPVCGRKCSGYDQGGRKVRRWRALDMCGLFLFIETSQERILCSEHGVQYPAVPWAYEGSRFTKDFDRTAAWLACHLSRKDVAEYLRIDWETVLKTTEFNQNRPLILTKRNITDFNQNMAECSRNTIISLSSAI